MSGLITPFAKKIPEIYPPFQPLAHRTMRPTPAPLVLSRWEAANRMDTPQAETSNFLIGLDLGQKGDFTALAVVEPHRQFDGVDAATYQPRRTQWLDVRHLERIPLGTSYPDVVEHVRALVASPELRGRSTLVVDATGVGAPVLDLLRRARLECRLIGVTITGGERQASGPDGWRVPKRDLISGLQIRLESGEVRMSKAVRMGPTLVKELMDMRVNLTEHGHETYAATRSGSHDDLVLAVALACWGVRFGPVGEFRGRLPIG